MNLNVLSSAGIRALFPCAALALCVGCTVVTPGTYTNSQVVKEQTKIAQLAGIARAVGAFCEASAERKASPEECEKAGLTGRYAAARIQAEDAASSAVVASAVQTAQPAPAPLTSSTANHPEPAAQTAPVPARVAQAPAQPVAPATRAPAAHVVSAASGGQPYVEYVYRNNKYVVVPFDDNPKRGVLLIETPDGKKANSAEARQMLTEWNAKAGDGIKADHYNTAIPNTEFARLYHQARAYMAGINGAPQSKQLSARVPATAQLTVSISHALRLAAAPVPQETAATPLPLTIPPAGKGPIASVASGNPVTCSSIDHRPSNDIGQGCNTLNSSGGTNASSGNGGNNSGAKGSTTGQFAKSSINPPGIGARLDGTLGGQWIKFLAMFGLIGGVGFRRSAFAALRSLFGKRLDNIDAYMKANLKNPPGRVFDADDMSSSLSAPVTVPAAVALLAAPLPQPPLSPAEKFALGENVELKEGRRKIVVQMQEAGEKLVAHLSSGRLHLEMIRQQDGSHLIEARGAGMGGRNMGIRAVRSADGTLTILNNKAANRHADLLAAARATYGAKEESAGMKAEKVFRSAVEQTFKALRQVDAEAGTKAVEANASSADRLAIIPGSARMHVTPSARQDIALEDVLAAKPVRSGGGTNNPAYIHQSPSSIN